MQLDSKVVVGLERLGEVFRTLLWQKAKVYGISPIQIQIVLFVSNHHLNLCNISYLAKEFNVTKPTISDAVRVLLKKGFLEKDLSPMDSRRYNLLLSATGKKLIAELLNYTLPVSKALENVEKTELKNFFHTLSKIIYQLHLKEIIQVQRTCFACSNYSGNKKDEHHCTLLNKRLLSQEIRLDCDEFE